MSHFHHRIVSLNLVVGLWTFLAGTVAFDAEAIELRDAGVFVGAESILTNPELTVRLEDSRLGHPGVPVPEPGPFVQLVAGGIGLGLLGRGRRRGAPGLGDSRVDRHE